MQLAASPPLRGLRTLLHRSKLIALDLLDFALRRHDPMVPSRLLTESVGMGGFTEQGGHLASIATELGALKPHERILDIGCGVGRLAVPLSSYLTTGEYVGFDLSSKAIEWCQTHVSARYPNFWFRHVDIGNSHYNPKGSIAPERFIFPCADESIDLAFASSVFTHLLPTTARQYFAEIRRVLKPRGRLVASFFLLDQAIQPQLLSFDPQFRYQPDPGYAVASLRDPEAAVAHEIEAVTRLLLDAGLAVSDIRRGQWAHHRAPLSYQDFLLVLPAAA